jgi:hypothetical protein
MIMRFMVVLCGALCAAAAFGGKGANHEPAPYINAWLVAGTFDNAPDNAGFDYDWVGETTVEPREGLKSGGRPWRYFDDRLFSRNYDDYQDLFSYFRIKRGESIRAKVVYAHVYVHSLEAQPVELRVGADNAFKAWVNGELVGSSTEGLPERDQMVLETSLYEGWNRLLLKVGNCEEGRLGFYARLTAPGGGAFRGATYAVTPPGGALAVSTRPMADAGTGALPTGWREWPYVGARLTPTQGWPPFEESWLRKPSIALQASDFTLLAEGGQPPYRWSVAEGTLPKGLSLKDNGRITGNISKGAELGAYAFTATVEDAAGARATRSFRLEVKERPNKWYEEARLTALIHHPESMPPDAFDDFADLMKRQGYGIGMVISYNNGGHRYRWPSIYEPDNENGILLGRYKAALEKHGVKFGMYIGNLNGDNHGGANGSILLVEDAMRRFQPEAFWFDWAGWNGVSLDAIYSMIKTYDPECLVVLNGIPTMSNGDWDVICLEGWGSWGAKIWDKWPFDFAWPKEHTVESWRLVADPAFEYSEGVQPDWREYLRLQIALIGDGFVANIDHSPTIASGVQDNGKLASLDDSPVVQAHRAMAAWANPDGLPPLHESYTRVNPGPLRAADWGYNTINLSRDAIYLHMLNTPYGKTGMPETGSVTVGPVAQEVERIVWLNTGKPVEFTQNGSEVAVNLKGVDADPIDTILKLVLAKPHPDVPAPPPPADQATPPGNLAWRKPSRLLSLDCTHPLIASAFNFAHYGNDGFPFTYAVGGMEWPWTYHVDLQKSHPVNRIVVHFAHGYPTEYNVLISEDGDSWRTIHHGAGSAHGSYTFEFEPSPTRYVRIQSVKPDGPNQEGSQMMVAEIEVYAASS